MFDPAAETPLTILAHRSNNLKYFRLDSKVVIISDSCSDHMQGEMDPEHTNTGDQEVF